MDPATERASLRRRARIHAALGDPARLTIVDALTLGGAVPLDEMRDLLTVLDPTPRPVPTAPICLTGLPRSTPAATALRDQLATAEGLANTRRTELDGHGRGAPARDGWSARVL
ncbi:hypothetical protein [Micromonospora aurantiaca (nom. illeg.)]|uniref:hypothetical protein n=1 Tax=Micromonospora aurantiaca (nom. illeg.) TaxID=47850 RepID=UPI003F4A1561